MSVKRTATGRWQARWREGSQARAITKDRKVDAEAHMRHALADYHRGHQADPRAGAAAVSAWADEWLSGAMNLSQGTLDTYRRDLDRYILPAIGAVPLAKLTDGHIDRFLSAELKAGKAASSVVRHYRTINRMLNVAVARGKLVRNPCAQVTPPKVRPTEMRFLTAGQVDALATAMHGRYRAWVFTAAYSGIRWSEGVGLRRANLAGDRLTVVETFNRRADKTWHRDGPKTAAGRRVITLPSFLVSELSVHLEGFGQPGPDGLVFPNQRGGPMGPSFAANVFKPALRRAGLDPATRVHDLRHTAVALAIAVGAHPKAIQVRMGHASITITLDRYGHLFPEMDQELAAGLDALRAAAIPPG